ncbi:MAG: glutaminase [Parasphingopyxis sp.]|uniref:glutaminase n=1 Tax=Parasphingopyxis sp. TaxID=1920299 RepID=UPI0026251808|nr:glutaminase [uncultured Parasphingopyxis sp.]
MNIEDIVGEVATAVEPHRGEGKVADYIPALACIDPMKFGIAVATPDGGCHAAGDAHEGFSVQSISKVFTLSLALENVGDALWQRVGREPSGTSFNSIVQLEKENGIPRNPLINAGAIVVTDHLIDGNDADAAIDWLLRVLRDHAEDASIDFDAEVARSESETGARNRSLAWFMKSFGNLENDVETVLSAYFRHCALRLSCAQLARAALFLAFDGKDPVTGERILTPQRCRRINAIMMSCGHYDNSGDFAFRIGLPGKSGVGGGILVVAPGEGTVAVWSPGLNEAGTSKVGALALEALVERTGWSVFG